MRKKRQSFSETMIMPEFIVIDQIMHGGMSIWHTPIVFYHKLNIQMKPSIYNIFFSYNSNEYVFNTLTTALLKLPPLISSKIESDNLTDIEKPIMDILQQSGVVVDDSLDELSAYRYYYNSIQYSEIHDELKVMVVPTYSCNLKCVYCFEECGNVGHRFDEKSVEQVITFIRKQIETHPSYKKLSLILFGGEPLVCKNQCIDLCRQLSALTIEKNVVFSPRIITNATLLDEQTVKDLILPHNMHIQVTLDGTKDIHNQRKIYKNGNGTYEQICNAIELLYKLGCKDNVDLRLNIDKNNIHCIEPLMDEFHDKVNSIYVGLLRPYGNNSCHTDSCISQNDFQIKYREQVLPILKKYNMASTSLTVGKQHPCAMNRLNTFVIDPFLDVYKCENFLGDKKHAVGHIVNGELQKYPTYYRQVAWTPFNAKCDKCALLPVCAGSCPHLCYMENGDMNKPLCSINREQLIQKLCFYIDDVSNK